MRIDPVVFLLNADWRQLSSGIDELDKRYAELSAMISAIWGLSNSFESYTEAQKEDMPYGRPYHSQDEAEASDDEFDIYVSSDFHLETLAIIRNTRLLLEQSPLHGPELKTYLHRWVFGSILQIASEHRTILEAGEPIEYEHRSLYWFAFEKLRSAISYYDFLCQPEPYIPNDPSYQGELPQLWRELIRKRESLLATLLTDQLAFSQVDVDSLLVYLGAVDKASRKWIKPKSSKEGAHSMFPAAYAALYQRGKVRMVPSTEWAGIFRLVYKAEISDSTAEKWAATDMRGNGALNKHYKKALAWLDTPPTERGNL